MRIRTCSPSAVPIPRRRTPRLAELISDTLLATPLIGSGVAAHENRRGMFDVAHASDVALVNLFVRRERLHRLRRVDRLHRRRHGADRVAAAARPRRLSRRRARLSSPPRVSRSVPSPALALSREDRRAARARIARVLAEPQDRGVSARRRDRDSSPRRSPSSPTRRHADPRRARHAAADALLAADSVRVRRASRDVLCGIVWGWIAQSCVRIFA